MKRAKISCDSRIPNRFGFCLDNSLLSLVVDRIFIFEEGVEVTDVIEKILSL